MTLERFDRHSTPHSFPWPRGTLERVGCRARLSPGVGDVRIPQSWDALVRKRGPSTRSARQGREGGAVVSNGPTDRGRHPRDVLLAEVQKIWVPLCDQIADDDLAIRVAERDGGRRIGVATHLGAGTHRARLNHTDVIFKHRTSRGREIPRTRSPSCRSAPGGRAPRRPRSTCGCIHAMRVSQWIRRRRCRGSVCPER